MADLPTVRREDHTTYVPAHPKSSRAYPFTDIQAQALGRYIHDLHPGVSVEPVFVPQDSVRENATPLQRSLALIVRLLPFTAIWLILSLAVVWMLDVDEIVGYLLFALLTASTYYRMDRSEREFSTNGLERHRIDVAAGLVREKLRTDARMRREITQAYLKYLEGPGRDEDPQETHQ
jgi:hypothetical protein